ncbi:hypothetical protein BC828DRAFT_63943 [Blastocladiella britannica]|nr:hypothetical protein BC828DRAFT_63943 [Blastocladiella britannica]
MSSLALLTRILHQTPTSERSALFAEQCNSLAVAQDFEDAHDLLRALLADGQLSSDEAVSLFDTFLARYLELKRLDATSLALAKSVYVTFLENCTVLRVRLLVQIPSLLAEHKFLAPAADPVVNQLDETSNGSMCTDAADALALACRLAQGGHFTTAQVTELYEHSLTGLVCFDRETRTAAASALPVFLLALSRDAPVNSHISTIMDRTLPLMASHPVLLAETAQVLTAILAVPELVVAGGALSVAAKSGAVICALLASVVLLESGPRKYAIHALHQFVDAARPVPTSAKVGKKRFKAITATTATAAQPPYVLQDSLFAAPAWEQWFLAYDLISESYQHMVKSAFAILDQEVVRSLAGTNGESGAVPFEWWLAVLQRGLLNDSLSSRKQVVTYVLSLPDSALEALCRHQAFLDRILEVLPAPGFFAINVQGAYVSPFGEKCSRFIANLLVMAPSLASSIVQHLAATRSTVWLLYGIQGLAQAAQKGAPIVTTFDQALAIANLTLNRSPTSEPARHFLDQQVMDVLVALQGDLRAVGTAKHMLTLVSRLKHFGHPAIAMWANSFEPADAVLEEIEALSTVPGSLGHVREAADCMAHLFAVLLPKDQLRIRERVIELVEELYSRPYLDAGVAEQRIAVLVALSDPEIDRRVAPSVTAFLAAKMSPAAISTVDALQVLSAALEHYAAHISDPDQLSHHALAILQADAENDTVPVQLTKNFALVGLSIARPPRLAFSDISPLRLQRPAHAPERWNDMISRFVSLKWEVIADILQASSDNGNVSASAVDALLDEIDNDHRESSIALIECAARLIDVDQHPGCFERALASVWQLVKSSASIPRHFYVLYPAFVAFLCTPKFVTHPTLHGAITTVMSNIVKLGATRFGVIDLMVAKLAPTLAADPELAWSFRSTIIDWLMFGPLRDRDEDRLETVWLKKLGQDYGGNPDYNVRVYANLLAAHIAGTAHGPKFFDLLLDSVFAPARNPAMEFPNQLVNREKLRLLSTLLMLAPTCVTVSSSSRIFERVISVLEGEPAVNLRPYYEWLLVLVGLHDAPECFRILSEQLGGYNDRAGKVTSLLLVAGHLLRALDDWTRMPAPGHVLTPSLSMDENSVQLAELVDMVLLRVPPWLASNHFAVRLHAQWILVRAWTICTRWCQSHYSFVEHFGGRKDTADLVQFMSTNKDCVKFKAKYLDPTYLTNDFHPPLLHLRWD